MTAPTLVAGSANPALAKAIAERLGVGLTGCRSERFPDGEADVALLDPVRGGHLRGAAHRTAGRRKCR